MKRLADPAGEPHLARSFDQPAVAGFMNVYAVSSAVLGDVTGRVRGTEHLGRVFTEGSDRDDTDADTEVMTRVFPGKIVPMPGLIRQAARGILQAPPGAGRAPRGCGMRNSTGLRRHMTPRRGML
jgi:hypothetical protein